ncbi:Mediator of RNA polymerase II transcription subunit 12-like protein [Trapelia coarctata]|nr:Mediator of RNA polymerase II transcription subunit 12-like protein [Trapelia coarctata]
MTTWANESKPTPPLVDEADSYGPVDSDEEKDAVMAAIARSRPQPLVLPVLMGTKQKYKYICMKEMLRSALSSVSRNNNNPSSAGGPNGPASSAAAAGGAAGGPGSFNLFSTSYGNPNANAMQGMNAAFANGCVVGMAGMGGMPPPIDTEVANMHRMGGMNSAALMSAGLGGGDSLFGSPLNSAGPMQTPRAVLPGGGAGTGAGGAGAGAAGGGNRKGSVAG